MTRNEALEIVHGLGVSPNIFKHLLANEAIMRSIALRFEPEKVDDWGLAGLAHDADYETTQKDISKHPYVVAEKLKAGGVSDEIINAILGHAEYTKVSRDTKMAKALFAGDNMAGLITACALVQPEKKLASVSVESVLKKFKNKSFAAGAKREEILTCESELDIPLAEFAKICLEAMQGISTELGL